METTFCSNLKSPGSLGLAHILSSVHPYVKHSTEKFDFEQIDFGKVGGNKWTINIRPILLNVLKEKRNSSYSHSTMQVKQPQIDHIT